MKRSLAAVSCKVSQDVGKGGTDGANRLPGDWKMSKLLGLARCASLASKIVSQEKVAATCREVGSEKSGGGGGRAAKGDSVLLSHTLRFLGRQFFGGNLEF